MNWISRPGWLGNLVALIAGALTPLALAPFNLWPFELLSLALLYLGLQHLAPRAALWRGWYYGSGLFLAGTSWIYISIHSFGDAPLLLAGGLTVAFSLAVAFFFALPTWLWGKYLHTPQQPLLDALAFAALWFGQELFRSWFLTGFPWLYAGYSQTEAPLAGLAPIGGVWLLSFVLALSAALLVQLPRLRGKQRLCALLLLISPWLGALALKQHAWTVPAGPPLSVTAVQGNIAQDMKWDPAHINAQLALYRTLTLNAAPSDLVVWPETAVPILQRYAGDYLQALATDLKPRHSALITGIPISHVNNHGETHYYNGLTVVGAGEGTYLKQKLVPFGEYVPLEDALRGLIRFFDLPMSDFKAGPANQPLVQAQGYSIATFICYEVVYPEFTAERAARSQLLLTISNDAWFGHSIGPLQHLQMAQMRALEAGRWMIRSTNNGVTALINPFGHITTRIPQFSEAVLTGTVVPMQQLTPYLRFQLWPLLIASLLLVAVSLWSRRQNR
jgi:apolipoprotein N-acyltransferase